MKKSFFLIILFVFCTNVFFTSCKPYTKEEIQAQDNFEDKNENAKKATQDLAAAKRAATEEEWMSFKKKTDSAIHSNGIRIDELKLKLKKTGKDIDSSYEKNIDTLKQKNAALKVKLTTYKNDANADWESFKREFNYDMDKLGEALKGLTVNNKK